MPRCAYHWDRRREEREGFKLVHGEWMCKDCFSGKPLEPKREYMTLADIMEAELLSRLVN